MQNTKERKRVYRIISWVLTVVMVIATLNLGGIPASKVFAVDYDVNILFSEEELEDGTVVSSVTEGDVSISFSGGTNTFGDAPTYYNNGAAVRCYGGNTFTVSSSNTIANIIIFCVTGDSGNTISANVGTMDGTTWTGSSSSVTFSIGGDSGHRSVSEIQVTYAEPAEPAALTKDNTKLLVDEFTYTGATIEPVVQYKASAEEEAVTLTKGTDYDVVQGGKDSATDADVYEFTINGKGAYSGNVTLDWMINPADVSGDKAMLDATKFFYTGEAITPVVQYQAIEEANAIELTKGTDYEVVQGGTDSATDMDTYSFTIKGKGNYTGEKTFEWKIVPEKPIAKEGLVYNGTAQELIYPADSGDTYEYRYSRSEDRDYSTTVPTKTSAGSRTVYYRYYIRKSISKQK